jgi:rhamnosyltransferase
VPEPFRDKNTAPRFVVEHNRIPLTERGRTDAKVNDTIKNLAGNSGDVFGLTGRNVSEVDAANHPALRHRHIGLPEVELTPRRLGKLVSLEPFEENAPIVGVLNRGHLEGMRNRQGSNVHSSILFVRPEATAHAGKIVTLMPNSTPLSSSAEAPLVTVLLATYNGARWLDEQLDTILDQEGVAVRVVALDDGSSDETPAILAARAHADSRVTVLESRGNAGGAAPNFYRLIRAIDIPAAGLIAFADQDDHWLPGKLAKHAALVAAGADGVSSDVTAFSETGPDTLIKKSYPQREFDYLLESPGPGCTFLMSNRLVSLARELLDDDSSEASSADFHDWLLYALCRAKGWTWIIDDEPSLRYRQHGNNAMGANVGAASAKRRLALMGSKWHRGEATLLARIALRVASDERRPGLAKIQDLLVTTGPRSRATLARTAGQLRRRPRDRAIIAVLVAFGIW